MSRFQRLLGQSSVGWGAIDQGLSSGTNFALMLLTVRSVDVQEFGAFSLVYLMYILVIPIARATGTMPYTITHAKSSVAEAAQATRASLRYAFALGMAVGLICLALGALSGPVARSSFVVLGLCFPLLLVQDAVRGVFFVRSEFRRAVVNDGAWAAFMFLVLVPLLLSDAQPPVVVFVAAWAVGGALAGVLGIVQLRVRLSVASPLVWLRANADLARPLFMSTLFMLLPAQVTYLLMPVVSSISELGTVRAVYVLFGILGVVYSTVSMIALPHASRLPPERARRFAAELSVAMALIATAWGALILFLPASIGRDIIGPIWDSTQTVRILLGISLIAEGITLGPTTVLASLKLPDRMAKVRYITAPLTLVAGLSLAAVWGAVGVSLGFVIGYSATALLSWWQVPSQTELAQSAADRPRTTSDPAE